MSDFTCAFRRENERFLLPSDLKSKNDDSQMNANDASRSNAKSGAKRNKRRRRSPLAHMLRTTSWVSPRVLGHLNYLLLDMIPVVFGKLRDSGYFFDPIKRDIELNFMADLIKKVQGKVNRVNLYICLQIFSATSPNFLDLSPTNLSAMLSPKDWRNTSDSSTHYIFISSEYILIKNIHIKNSWLPHFLLLKNFVYLDFEVAFV